MSVVSVLAAGMGQDTSFQIFSCKLRGPREAQGQSGRAFSSVLSEDHEGMPTESGTEASAMRGIHLDLNEGAIPSFKKPT